MNLKKSVSELNELFRREKVVRDLKPHSDYELLSEVLRRCLARLGGPITSRRDDELRDLLYEAGKKLLQRNP